MEGDKGLLVYEAALRKGGKKEGLGFGSTTETSVPKSETYRTLSNFVREASPKKSAAIHKEISIESIRDKLKKREDNPSRGVSSRARSPDDQSHGTKTGDKVETKARGRKTPDRVPENKKADKVERTKEDGRRTADSESEDRKKANKVEVKKPGMTDYEEGRKKEKRRRRSSSSERIERPPAKKSLEDRKKEKSSRRHRSSSTERTDRPPAKKSPEDSKKETSTRRHRSSSSESTERVTVKNSLEDRRKERSTRRRRSSSSERMERAPANKSYGQERRKRSLSPVKSNGRTISKSPSPDGGKSKGKSGTGERELGRRKHQLREPRNRSPSSDASGKSSDRSRKQSRRSRKRKSVSPIEDSTSRHRSRIPSTKRRQSPSKSYDESARDRSRSRSSGRDVDYRGSYRRGLPYESRRREGSRSPRSYRSLYKHGDNRWTGGSERRHLDDRRVRNEDDRRRKNEEDNRKDGSSGRPRSREAKEKPAERDYSKLIPNFDDMTPAEKVKAKMKLQLSETVVKDHATGMSVEWERFDFDKNAPLDDDAKLDYFGDGTGANDDTFFLKNTGSSYLSSSNQVTRESHVKSTHETAIFGPPEGLLLKVLQRERHSVTAKKDPVSDTLLNDSGVGNSVRTSREEHKSSATAASSVISEQVIAMQQAGSWQERARKMKEAREAALTS